MFPLARYQDRKELHLKAYVTNIHASKRVHHVQQERIPLYPLLRAVYVEIQL